MKRFFVLFFVLFSVVAAAKPARFYYYCLAPAQNSVSDDGFVSVELVTLTNQKTYVIPGVSSVDYAHPALEIIVKNNSQNNVTIYMSDSSFKFNSYETSLVAAGPWNSEHIIPAGESRTFSVEMITEKSLPHVSNLFSMIKVPVLGEMVPAGKQLGVHVGQYQSYSEGDSLLKLSTQIVYAVEGETDKYAVATSYYLNAIVGIPHGGTGKPQIETLSTIYPECMSDKYETFILIQ